MTLLQLDVPLEAESLTKVTVTGPPQLSVAVTRPMFGAGGAVKHWTVAPAGQVSAGAVVSFDLNFRAKLWQISGGLAKAHETLRRICANVDVLVGNEEDLQKGLGLKGPEVEAKHKLDPSAFFGMMDQVAKELPNIKIVATTLREVHSTNRHDWSAVAWINGKTHVAPTCELDVLDRVGGGDGFAAGFFYGLLSGASPEEALKLGWAHGGLLTTTPGDTTMVTLDQVQAFAKGGSARIQR